MSKKFSDNTMANLMNNQKANTTKANKRTNKKSSKKPTIREKALHRNHSYAIRLPMSCTLDVHTIGKLQALKQILHFHNRDQTITTLFNGMANKLIKTKKQKKAFKLYYKVFLMQNTEKARQRYISFYKKQLKTYYKRQNI